MKPLCKFILISVLISPLSAYCQKYQIAIGAGPSLLYVVEDVTTNTDYFYGMSYQNDFIFLNEEQLPNFGFSLTSSSVEQHFYSNNYRIINNTSLMASKYYSTQFFNFLSGNLEIGAGLNHQSYNSYPMGDRTMLNLQIGGRIQAEILPNFFVHAKGLAVGQDVTNIIRFYSTGDWVTAGEDMHLLLFFGLALNFGHTTESNNQ